MTAGLERRATDAAQRLRSVVGLCAQVGVGTDDVKRMLQSIDWALGEVPTLKRRQSLAAAWDLGEFGAGGYVPAGAGDLGRFPSSAAAAKAGADDGRKLKELLRHGRDDDIAPYIDKIGANKADADYAAALYRMLGASGTAALGSYVRRLLSSGEKAEADGAQRAIGDSLGLASHKTKIDEKWLAGFNRYGDHYNYELMAPLMKYGSFSDQWLDLVGHRLLADNGGMLPPRSENIWEAMSRNPRFATDFFSRNHDKILHIANRSISGTDGAEKGVPDFIHSATIDGRDVNPKLAEANVRDVASYYRNNPTEHAVPQVQRIYADIVDVYWDDLFASVTSPSLTAGNLAKPNDPAHETTAVDNPFGPGIGMPDQYWGGLLQETLRDPEAAAHVLARYGKWKEGGIGSGEDNYWVNYTRNKLFPEYMRDQFMKAAGAAEDKRKAFNQRVETVIGKGIDWSVAPHGALKDMSLMAIKKSISLGISAINPSDQPQVNPDVFSHRRDWSQFANDGLKGSGGSLGDPRKYEERFGLGVADGFIDPATGGARDIDEIVKNPRTLAAYNAWLVDPAVVDALKDRFSPGD
ncbi:hypothetical protein [Actinomadura sp. DC4]|uniref:hypothetical protein n=1 Tax=Actinomadura sp. DC4 TaxID=3055069 RepID=UPI0025B17996|nr:hypothetical protein [Actinomadura sp. DC4]MDN3357078.1 hypothetical protein [Actinomadura sp. DC4]